MEYVVLYKHVYHKPLLYPSPDLKKDVHLQPPNPLEQNSAEAHQYFSFVVVCYICRFFIVCKSGNYSIRIIKRKPLIHVYNGAKQK